MSADRASSSLETSLGVLPVSRSVAHARLWAPDRHRVSFVTGDGAEHRLAREADGYFHGMVPVTVGARYGFRVDDDARIYPDPASRFQPDGPHELSQVVDARDFAWTDRAWPGCRLDGQVFYEIHVGTFTSEGTWTAAARKLDLLARLGVTIVEVMPVADFPGHFGWGYDGVSCFGPTRLYGRPDDFRAFVDRAHALGLGVVLDVVYNHVGPDGNYLGTFARDYFRHEGTEWGDAFNFDGPGSAGVRAFVLANVEYWIREFHLDGFRFDATDRIIDTSTPHILADVARHARAAAGARDIVLVAENDEHDLRLIEAPQRGGFGLDAIWTDDLHHAVMVGLSGARGAYYRDYAGTMQELVSCAKHGVLYQGQHSRHRGRPRGSPTLAQPMRRFVWYVENHDQVANPALGERLARRISPGRYRALAAFLLLLPATPLLFQGQEFGSTRPFPFFADPPADMAGAVREGRGRFLAPFATPAQALLDPTDIATFEMARLDWNERDRNSGLVRLFEDLLRLRREDGGLRQASAGLDGAVLGNASLAIRMFGDGGNDRLLLLNLGEAITIVPSEPLLAPPAGRGWSMLWSSERAAYGGEGDDVERPLERLGGERAVLLAAASRQS